MEKMQMCFKGWFIPTISDTDSDNDIHCYDLGRAMMVHIIVWMGYNDEQKVMAAILINIISHQMMLAQLFLQFLVIEQKLMRAKEHYIKS